MYRNVNVISLASSHLQEFTLLETPSTNEEYNSLLSKLAPRCFLRDFHMRDFLLVFPGGTSFHDCPLYKNGTLILQVFVRFDWIGKVELCVCCALLVLRFMNKVCHLRQLVKWRYVKDKICYCPAQYCKANGCLTIWFLGLYNLLSWNVKFCYKCNFKFWYKFSFPPAG